jgi:hypothetical protein
MIELVREAERRSLNVIALSDLLDGTNARFRKAVLEALLKEGFELDETMPSLQHPLELLGAIDWLETLDFGTAWDSFLLVLLEAGRTGILVDMRCKPGGSTRFRRGVGVPASAMNSHPVEIV